MLRVSVINGTLAMATIYRLFAFLLILFPHFAFSQAAFLKECDVRSTVDRLIEYHVDTKQISADILARSLKDYTKAFDPHHVYLLEQEVSSILSSGDIKKRLLKNYQTDDVSVYQTLNHQIQESIERARQWRKEWIAQPTQLVQEATLHAIEKRSTQHPTTLQEAKIKQRALLLSYLSMYLADNHQNYKGREEALVRLCVRQLESHENPYLGFDDCGQLMSQEEDAHHFHIRIIKSIAHSLDAHTAYFSRDEALAMRVQLEKGMCGIGVVLKEDVDGVVVKEIVPGGPAEKSGKLCVNDIIYIVDGENIENLSFRKILDLLRGEQGSTVNLGIRREHEKKTVQLKREKILLEDRRVNITYEPYGDGIIGKITLYSFYEGDNHVSSENDLKKAIEQLQDKNLLGLVLDIRENTGGFLSQAIKVSGLFMTNGVVVVSRYADGSTKRYRTIAPKRFYDGPLVVLTSKSSASAAEIVAQTLQDYGIALIVGDEQTYGKGTIQHQTITSDNQSDFFKVTIGRYYSPSGTSTQLQGVKSDILVCSRYAEETLGERFLENPLPADQCQNVLDDNLSDLNQHVRPWFQKYYLPNLQKQEHIWRNMLPQLVANSKQRLEKNSNYQAFIKDLKHPSESHAFGSNDLQLEESVNIIKDMIFLRNQNSSEVLSLKSHK